MRTSKKLGVVAGASALLIGGGVAMAFWTTSGTGTGSATTSAGAANLTIAQTSTISNLYPGDSEQTISGTVKNNAANNAYVTKVVVSIASVTKAAGAPAGICDATDYLLSGETMTVGSDLAKDATAPFTGATLKFNNKAESQDACKGATVNLAYLAS